VARQAVPPLNLKRQLNEERSLPKVKSHNQLPELKNKLLAALKREDKKEEEDENKLKCIIISQTSESYLNDSS